MSQCKHCADEAVEAGYCESCFIALVTRALAQVLAVEHPDKRVAVTALPRVLVQPEPSDE